MQQSLAIMNAQDVIAAIKFFKELTVEYKTDNSVEGIRMKEFLNRRIMANLHMLEVYQVNTMQMLAPNGVTRYMLGTDSANVVQLALPFADAIEVTEDIKMHKKLKGATSKKEVKQITWDSQNARVGQCNTLIDMFLKAFPQHKNMDKNNLLKKMWLSTNPEKEKRHDPFYNMRRLVFDIFIQSSITTANKRTAEILKDWKPDEIAQFVSESVYHFMNENEETKLSKVYNPVTGTEYTEEFKKSMKNPGNYTEFFLKREFDVLSAKITHDMEEDDKLSKLLNRKKLKKEESEMLERIKRERDIEAKRDALRAWNAYKGFYGKSPYTEKGFDKKP
jgi:hypothetical protein